jgi:hypothetical protein
MTVVTPVDLAHELGLHQKTIRSRLRAYFAARHPHGTRWELTRQESEEFLAWHAGRYAASNP